MKTKKARQISQSLLILIFLSISNAFSLAYTMQDAGISQRAQDYINTMQYSSDAVNHVAFQNCLRDIISSETVPGTAIEITSEAQLSQIQSGGTYVIRGNLTFNNTYYPPSNVTIYVDGSIHKDGYFTAPGGVHSTENSDDAIFKVDYKTNVNIIGVNNAQLTGNWITGAPAEPGTTAVYVGHSNYVTVEGFDIGYVWEGLVARGSNDHIYFLRNYIHDTRKRAIWFLTSDVCEAGHNFVDNAGVDGIDFDAYADDNIAFENVVIGAGRWCGFVEEGAKRNIFLRNAGVLAFFNNPNSGWQMGWADNGTTQGVVDHGGLTEHNYFIANIIIEPSQFTTSGGGDYFAKQGVAKGPTYFWDNEGYGAGQSTGNFYNAEWLDYLPMAGGENNSVNGQQILDDMDTIYNPDISAPLVVITESDGSTDVAEEGTMSDTYTIVLDTQPIDTVMITVDPDVDTEVNSAGAGNSIQLIFYPIDWNIAQTVTVTAIDDSDIEGSHNSTITHTATSNDPVYDGVDMGNIIAIVADNESSHNLLLDPAFESGILNDWNAGWGARDISSTEHHTGQYCGHVNNGAVTQQISLIPDTTYTYSGYVKSATGGQVYLGVKDHGNSETAVSTTSSSYQYLSIEFTTGADPSATKIYVWSASGGYADDLMLTSGQWDCAAIIAAGLGMSGDLSGPTGVPDCYVDVYDLVKMSEMWLTSTDMDDLAVLAGQWMRCIDPTNENCIY